MKKVRSVGLITEELLDANIYSIVFRKMQLTKKKIPQTEPLKGTHEEKAKKIGRRSKSEFWQGIF